MSQLALRRPAEPVRETSLTKLNDLNELHAMGAAMARSNFFQERDVAQAMVKIQAGQELGIPPYAAMNGIHVIKGKCCLSANMIAAMVKRSGRYNYKVLAHDATQCSLAFTEGGEPCGPPASFTIAEAQQAGLTGNDNWKKYPKAMLFARALTFGARTYCADIFLGPIYVPEEMGAEVDGEGEPLKLVEVKANEKIILTPAQPEHIPGTDTAALVDAEKVKAPRVISAELVAQWTGIPILGKDGKTSADFLDAAAECCKLAGIPFVRGEPLTDKQHNQLADYVANEMDLAITFNERSNAAKKPAAAPSPAVPAPTVLPSPLVITIGLVTREPSNRTRIDTDHGPFYTFSNTVAKEARENTEKQAEIAHKLNVRGDYDILNLKLLAPATVPPSPPKAGEESQIPADDIPF